MDLRYDDRTGMFKEVSTIADRLKGIGRFFGRALLSVFMLTFRVLRLPLGILFYPVMKWWAFFRKSWCDGDRFLACVMILLGLVLIGVYRLAWEILLSFSFFDDLGCPCGAGDSVALALMIGAAVLFVVFYVRALAAARAGDLVVYRDWTDFGRSALWVLAFPIALPCIFDTGSDWLFRSIGLAFFLLGSVSLWEMAVGAFQENTGGDRWLALFARVGVILLLVVAVAKVHERLERYRRGELGVIRGVLLPLAVFAWVFNGLVRPMIRSERRRMW